MVLSFQRLIFIGDSYMYSAFSIILLIGVGLVVAGVLGGVGTDGKSDVSKNVASAIGLLVTYSFLILSMSSFSELASVFENLCGGIPYMSVITDYGSLRNVLSENPKSAAVAFLDSVILAALIELIMMLPLGHNQKKKHFWNSGNLMTNLFVAIISAIAGLLILNYFIKTSDIYHTIVSIIGSIIVILSVGTIPMVIITLIQKKRLTTVAVATGIGLLFLFSKSKIMGTLRSAVYKAIVYVGGIWILEEHFGSLANGMSFISSVFVAFGPVLVMLIGLYFIVKSMMA